MQQHSHSLERKGMVEIEHGLLTVLTRALGKLPGLEIVWVHYEKLSKN